MERDWERLGSTVRAARKAKGLTQQELGALVQVSRAAIQQIEQGKQFTKVTPALRAVEHALGWQRGSVEGVLGGGDPTLAPNPDGPTAPGARPAPAPDVLDDAQLPLRVRQALGEGHLLDATVIDLPAEGSDEAGAQIVIVVKGKPTTSPEQMRKHVAAWERLERGLRAASAEAGESPTPDEK